MKTIYLINDQPYYSGMGRYAFKICEYLHGKFLLRYFSLDGKPYYWRDKVGSLSRDAIYHFTNQNLSFLRHSKRTIITCHDLAPLIFPDNKVEKIWRRYLYSGMKKANLIFADSYSTQKDLKKIYGINAKKIRTIYLGVDHNKFCRRTSKESARQHLGLRQDIKIIINVGTEKRRKNIPNLLMAMAKLIEYDKNIFLIRIGSSTSKTKKLIHSLGIVDNVKYYQYVSDIELSCFYIAADLCVMPSFYEGFGLPVIEAMSCGVPVITGNTSAFPEIVGDVGIMINPYSTVDLFWGMKQLIENEPWQRELGEGGMERANRFSWQNTAEQVGYYYEKIC